MYERKIRSNRNFRMMEKFDDLQRLTAMPDVHHHTLHRIFRKRKTWTKDKLERKERKRAKRKKLLYQRKKAESPTFEDLVYAKFVKVTAKNKRKNPREKRFERRADFQKKKKSKLSRDIEKNIIANTVFHPRNTQRAN